MIANIVVIAAVTAGAVILFLKADLVKSVSLVISAIFASIISFSYFELLADMLITKSQDDGSFEALMPWSYTIFLILLFVIVFVVFQMLAYQLLKRPIDLGPITEKAGRVICGILLGLIVSGVLITALSLGNFSAEIPYSRFESRVDPDNPKGTLLGADSFAVSWINMASAGGLSGKKSFAVVHAGYLDQIHLNRLVKDTAKITVKDALKVPSKNAAWLAPAGLIDGSDPNLVVSVKSGYDLTIVRVGIKRKAVKREFSFTPGQVRLICKPKSQIDKPLAGKGISVYASGYMEEGNFFYVSRLNESFKITFDDVKEEGVKWYDFGFYIPNDYLPVLVELKQNATATIKPKVDASKVSQQDLTDSGSDNRDQ